MTFKFGFEEKRFGIAIGKDQAMLMRREPPIEGHQQGAQPRGGKQQHEHIRMVVAEKGDAIAFRDPKAGQPARRALRARPKVGVGKIIALEVEGGPAGGVLRPAFDEAG